MMLYPLRLMFIHNFSYIHYWLQSAPDGELIGIHQTIKQNVRSITTNPSLFFAQIIEVEWRQYASVDYSSIIWTNDSLISIRPQGTQWKFIWNSNVLIQENTYGSVICKIVATLPSPQCIKLITLYHMFHVVLSMKSLYVTRDGFVCCSPSMGAN